MSVSNTPPTPRPKRATGKRGSAGAKTSAKRRSGHPEELAALNAHPLNQHALALLPKWALIPDDSELHLLTLVGAAGFATKVQAAMLKKMRNEWAPSEVVDYFSRVATFEELFLAQRKPLEAVQVILAAVDLIAEPQRFLPAFQLE